MKFDPCSEIIREEAFKQSCEDFILEEGNIFSDCVTIDPSESENAWKTLSQDTAALELISIPSILHKALLNIIESKSQELKS